MNPIRRIILAVTATHEARESGVNYGYACGRTRYLTAAALYHIRLAKPGLDAAGRAWAAASLRAARES